MKTIINDNHWSLSCAADIKAICRPLAEHLHSSFFGYLRTFDDGSEIRFCSEPEYIRAHYDNKFYALSCYEKSPRYYESGYIYPDTQHPTILKFYQEQLKLPCGFIMSRKLSDGCEFFYFTQKGDSLQNLSYYLANVDLLERFTFYFKERAKSLFEVAHQNKIIIPGKLTQVTSDAPELHYLKNSEARNKFLAMMQLDQVTLQSLGGCKITGREIECLTHIVRGKTANEIAKAVGLSPRTVEHHTAVLKDKFDCKNKSALIHKLASSPECRFLFTVTDH